MSSSYTLSETFTIAHARHLGSRVAADLRLMNGYYGKPSLAMIEDYLEEIAQFLVGGYLSSFEAGFRRKDQRVFSLYYQVRADGTLGDSRAGGVLPGHDISGATYFSYLTHSDAWLDLDPYDRARIEAALPIQRTAGAEPVDGDGYWIRDDRTYAAGGVGLSRGRFVPR